MKPALKELKLLITNCLQCPYFRRNIIQSGNFFCGHPKLIPGQVNPEVCVASNFVIEDLALDYDKFRRPIMTEEFMKHHPSGVRKDCPLDGVIKF